MVLARACWKYEILETILLLSHFPISQLLGSNPHPPTPGNQVPSQPPRSRRLFKQGYYARTKSSRPSRRSAEISFGYFPQGLFPKMLSFLTLFSLGKTSP